MPLCKKCKQFPSIEFLDDINISLDCQCHAINRMIKICEYTPLEIEVSSESNSKPKLELNEKTINSKLDSNDKKENNEYLLKKNLKGFNANLNTNLKENEEINDNNNMSSETYNEIDLEENKKKQYYISIKEEDLYKCIRHKKEFINYCVDCKLDLCIDCLNMESDIYSNTFIKNKKHENHTKISLEEIKDKFDEIDKLIEKTMKNEKVFKINSSNLTIILKIIKCFINNYEKYKCYNLKVLKMAKNF